VNKQVKESLLALAIVSASSSVLAIEPAPVELGGFQMIPTLNISTGYDDNPFSETNGNPDDSFVTTITPNLQFLAQQGESIYSLDVGVTRGIFHDSTDDNYTDFTLNASSHLVFDSKNSVDLTAGYFDGHEDRGSGATQGISDFISGPTEFDDTTFGAKYTYGSQSSQGRIELSADYLSKSFDDNAPEIVLLNQNRERKDISVAAKFFYAISSDTDITAEVKSTDIEYETGVRDNDEIEYFIGLEWQATAKTSGYAKIGAGDKDFDAGGDSGTEVSWDVGVTWEPRSYSTVDIYTSREEEETSSTGNFIDTTVYGVTWNHGWTEQISTNLGYNFRNEEYVGSLQDDDTDNFVAGIKYAFDRWLDIGLTYDYSDKSSSINTLEYDRSKVILSFDVSL